MCTLVNYKLPHESPRMRGPLRPRLTKTIYGHGLCVIREFPTFWLVGSVLGSLDPETPSRLTGLKPKELDGILVRRTEDRIGKIVRLHISNKQGSGVP